MKKVLVYLDQSYVSSMAKEDADKTRTAHATVGAAMGELLRLLRELVDRDKILCPGSIVHDQELGLDDRVEEPGSWIVKELSDAISFHTYREIQLGQAVRAMCRYLGLESETEGSRWQHAFMRDPHQPITRPRVYIRIPWHPAFAQDDRRKKVDIQAHRFQGFLGRASASYSSFDECRRQHVLSVARLAYWEPYDKYVKRALEAALGLNPPPELNEEMPPDELLDYIAAITPPMAAELFEEYRSLTAFQDPLPDKRFWEFLLSAEFGTMAFNDIFCSLDAGFNYYKPQRKPRPSDPYDMVALASVMSYVDIVTTDSGMKDMLIQLELDAKYGVEVYSSRAADIQALTQRLRQLA